VVLRQITTAIRLLKEVARTVIKCHVVRGAVLAQIVDRDSCLVADRCELVSAQSFSEIRLVTERLLERDGGR
jgi:hypothetical protein